MVCKILCWGIFNSLNNAPLPAILDEVNLNQMKTLIYRTSHYLRKKANILKISKSSTETYLHHFGYGNHILPMLIMAWAIM